MCDSKNPGTNRDDENNAMISCSERQETVVRLAVMGSCYGMSYQESLPDDG